jgi:predicted DNA-binding protein (MmcQ/YjbR family)
MGKSTRARRAELELRDFALSFPETTEEFPWGHRTIKVKGKAFIFMSSENGGLGLSVKLPTSSQGVLMLPFASPTGYGLSKSGWVTATFGEKDAVPVEWVRDWITESYRAVAPKRLLKELSLDADEIASKARPVRRPAKKRTQTKK